MAISGDDNHKRSKGLMPVAAQRIGPDLKAIAQSVNIAERLRRAKISFVTTNYDVATAHPSLSHASLSEALVDTRHEDTGLLKQRHELATTEIQGADDSILIRPGSGIAQGSAGAADAFHRVYHKRIEHPLLPRIFSSRLCSWSSQITRMMFGSLRLPRNQFTHGQE